MRGKRKAAIPLRTAAQFESGISLRSIKRSEATPILEVIRQIQLRNLADPVGHLDASAPEELIVILFQERRCRHTTPAPGQSRLTAEPARGNLNRRCASRRVVNRQPDIDLRYFPNDDAVVDQIAVLEERVLIHSIAFTGSRLRVGIDDGGIVLQVAELI